MKVGFIGLGIMGASMASNVQKGGHALVVHDLRAEAAKPHLAAGAVWADTPRQVAEASDVVLTSLPGPPEVEAVALGEHGLLAGLGAHKAYFDLSTNSPTVVRRIHATFARRGVPMLDAPVSGGPRGAEIAAGPPVISRTRSPMTTRTRPRNRWNLPDLGVGIGLRTVHYEHILQARPDVDFFEVLSENYLDTGGRPAWVLDQIAERYPVVLHGVSLSIGSTDPLDRTYLASLKRLADEVRPAWVSDHLCWTGVNGHNSHDLLPMPLTEESLAHVAERVRQVQDFLERPLILENPSAYVRFAQSTMEEPDFLRALADETGCGLLLDVNNVYVSARNHGFDAKDYLDAMPADRVAEIHLAGHTLKSIDGIELRIDDHASPVPDAVWALYRRTIGRIGARPTLIEWDAEIPALDVLLVEAAKADRILDERREAQDGIDAA